MYFRYSGTNGILNCHTDYCIHVARKKQSKSQRCSGLWLGIMCSETVKHVWDWWWRSGQQMELPWQVLWHCSAEPSVCTPRAGWDLPVRPKFQHPNAGWGNRDAVPAQPWKPELKLSLTTPAEALTPRHSETPLSPQIYLSFCLCFGNPPADLCGGGEEACQ